jgi:FMN phosphatase YigB (HAD superfamily)
MLSRKNKNTNKKSKPEIVVLDMLGIAFYDGRSEVIENFHKHSQKDSSYIRRFVFGDLYNSLREGEIDFWTYSRALGEVGIATGKKFCMEQWFNQYPLRDGIVELIRDIHEAELKTAAFSNIFPELLAYLDDKNNEILNHFDWVVTSYDIKTRKPRKAAFEALEERVGFSGQQIVYIDNETQNVRKAEEYCNWNPVHVHNVGNDPDAVGKMRNALVRKRILQKVA